MRFLVAMLFGSFLSTVAKAQLYYDPAKIKSAYTIKDEKATARTARIIAQAESLNTIAIPGTEDDKADLDAALWATSQFMVRTANSDAGVKRLMKHYALLGSGTQRSLLELVYGLYPNDYETDMESILKNGANIRIRCIAAAYLFRHHKDAAFKNRLKGSLAASGLAKAGDYADAFDLWASQQLNDTALPPLDSLLALQAKHGFKVIYSFQRSNRDLQGLAVVQDSNGKLMRDSAGKLLSFVQLARSASNLPFFITNGSTPQGLYAITGTGISRNVFIGPTPNLQTVMMGEVNPPVFTHYFPMVFNATPWHIYTSYFPENWLAWPGMAESFIAGQLGRSEIIAHGTTIDPEWFKGSPYYPVSPTLGCLCGREVWDEVTGGIIKSDQLDMVNAFISTPGTKGYLMVINLPGTGDAVTREELEELLKDW